MQGILLFAHCGRDDDAITSAMAMARAIFSFWSARVASTVAEEIGPSSSSRCDLKAGSNASPQTGWELGGSRRCGLVAVGPRANWSLAADGPEAAGGCSMLASVMEAVGTHLSRPRDAVRVDFSCCRQLYLSEQVLKGCCCCSFFFFLSFTPWRARSLGNRSGGLRPHHCEPMAAWERMGTRVPEP